MLALEATRRLRWDFSLGIATHSVAVLAHQNPFAENTKIVPVTRLVSLLALFGHLGVQRLQRLVMMTELGEDLCEAGDSG
jgi:hypothetical protein